MTGANAPAVPRKKKARIPVRAGWKWSDGWRAAAWAAICVEGILAGGDRPCMPSFDIGILLGQMGMLHVLGIAELLVLCAAVPAFVVASNPRYPDVASRHRAITIAAFSIVTLMLQLFFDNPALWVPVMGFTIGSLIRWYDWARSSWLVLAVLTAAAFGVIQFSGKQYGLNNCWP